MSIIPQKLPLAQLQSEEIGLENFSTQGKLVPFRPKVAAISPLTPNSLLTLSELTPNSLINGPQSRPMPISSDSLRVEIAAEEMEIDLWHYLVHSAELAVQWIEGLQVEGQEKTDHCDYKDDVYVFAARAQFHSEMSPQLEPEEAAEKVPWDDLPENFGRDIYGNEIEPYIRFCNVWKKIERPMSAERGDLYKAYVYAERAPLQGRFNKRQETLRRVASVLYHFARLNNFRPVPLSQYKLQEYLQVPQRTLCDCLTNLVEVKKWATLVQKGTPGTFGKKLANVYRWDQEVEITFV